MDEHDKRAREVLDSRAFYVGQGHEPKVAAIAALLRSTATAAVAAERERCAKTVEEYGAPTGDYCPNGCSMGYLADRVRSNSAHVLGETAYEATIDALAKHDSDAMPHKWDKVAAQAVADAVRDAEIEALRAYYESDECCAPKRAVRDIHTLAEAAMIERAEAKRLRAALREIATLACCACDGHAGCVHTCPAQAERPSAAGRLGTLLDEAGARVTFHPELVGSDGAVDYAKAARERLRALAIHYESTADAHARGCRETQVRIAARLRARADEETKEANRLALNVRVLDAAQHRRLASVLRSEADALEGT